MELEEDYISWLLNIDDEALSCQEGQLPTRIWQWQGIKLKWRIAFKILNWWAFSLFL